MPLTVGGFVIRLAKRAEGTASARTAEMARSFGGRSDPAELAEIKRIEAETLHLDISDRRPLAETPSIHGRSQSSAGRGRVVFPPEVTVK